MKLVKQIGYKRIYAVDTFCDEYRALYQNSGAYDAYLKKLRLHLQILDNAKDLRSALLHKDIEALENTRLHCIRHVSSKNPRTIFFYALDEDIYILLHTFFEKDTAKDYKRAIRRANAILAELLPPEKEGQE